MIERFMVVPAAYIVFRRDLAGDDEVLLQLRQNTGYMDGHWAMAAAGHVEAKETVVEAACREATEELDVTVDASQLRPLCVMHRTGGTGLQVDERVDFFFECRQWAGAPRLVELEKTADLRWFGLRELPQPMVPHESLVLDHLRAGAVPSMLTFGFGR